MSEAVIITAMICATVLIIFHMSLVANASREEDDRLDG